MCDLWLQKIVTPSLNDMTKGLHELLEFKYISRCHQNFIFGTKIMILNNDVVVVKDGFTNSLYAIKDRIWKHP